MSGSHRGQGAVLDGLDRADLVLLAIPLAFCAVYAVGSLLAQGNAVPVAGASLAAGALVVDGLFFHPPNEA
ncbi:hypothetical protein PN419_03505 [Halorubrum ezzemoulense]|jgi:hypothetical protein|uniref:Uncharacterized protein n=1 Tax=Halorubrum ezzemoulense TaxID=337243 RepID=A0A238V0Z9_HALEZ|nr:MULTISPECIES: hypothetical protein [Halorubrum]MDB2260826.1 hypothetical protein [Halorubrum ezzemoulense]MDB2263145.1 hypothetical protein [Halorubrum ezzemoulense]MDB2267902.1 hypothetical protein [Halorubrum ezzemoulense]MDB9248079.1 hypothetical protein [Halorubrum ezzemoulense]MDB9258012.1 hypothetical protein [Halorubrum ezzemoulense]